MRSVRMCSLLDRLLECSTPGVSRQWLAGLVQFLERNVVINCFDSRLLTLPNQKKNMESAKTSQSLLKCLTSLTILAFGAFQKQFFV